MTASGLLRQLTLAALSLALVAAHAPDLPHPQPGGEGGPGIVVIVSQDVDPYRQALAGFRRTLERAVPLARLDVIMLRGDTARLAEAIATVRRSRPVLVLTLGTLATRGLVATVHDVPIVAGMILDAGELGRASNATGVYLEYPVAVELEWLRRVLPEERRVGVIYHSAQNGARVAQATRLAPDAGLSIEAIRVEGPAEIPDALVNLTNQADVLWGLTDPVVYTAETARSLLLFSLRNRIPFVGQSVAWVRAGALYALDRDYDDVGAQCAELAARILAGQSPGSIAPQPPRTVRYAINQRTAAELNLRLPAHVLREAVEVVN